MSLLNGYVGYDDYIKKLFSMHFTQTVYLMTFNPYLACSYTINITMHCETIHMQFYDNFVLLDWYDTDKICSINITYFHFAKFALK